MPAALLKSIQDLRARPAATIPRTCVPQVAGGRAGGSHATTPRRPGRRPNAAGQAAPPLLQHAACVDRSSRSRRGSLARILVRCVLSRPSGRIAQLVEQLTLNQRVQGSSPCAPTIVPQRFFPLFSQNILDRLGAQLGGFVLFSSFRMAFSPSAGSRAR